MYLGSAKSWVTELTFFCTQSNLYLTMFLSFSVHNLEKNKDLYTSKKYKTIYIYIGCAYVFNPNTGFLVFLRHRRRFLSSIGVSHNTGGMLGHAFGHQARLTRPCSPKSGNNLWFEKIIHEIAQTYFPVPKKLQTCQS